MIIGTILLGSSTTLAQLLVGRIVTGIGNGFNSSTIPMYQSEMCKPRNRGMLLSMQGTVTSDVNSIDAVNYNQDILQRF